LDKLTKNTFFQTKVKKGNVKNFEDIFEEILKNFWKSFLKKVKK